MNDLLDPSEAHASALKAPDAGEMGMRFSWKMKPLRPYSLADKNAMDRVAWESMTDAEYAQCLVFLLTQRTGAQASAIRGDAAVNAFHAAKDVWAEKEGAMRDDIRSSMITLCKAVLDDVKKAESVEPTPSGTPVAPGNA